MIKQPLGDPLNLFRYTSNMSATHSVCFLCNSGHLKTLDRYAQQGLLQCKSCDFVFCSGIPTTEELIRHYNTYPRHDSISPITIKRYKELISSFSSFRKTGNWIDVGCGNGHLLSVAAECQWNTYGTEFTDDAVEICRKKNIRMHQGVLDPSNYPPGSFDVVTFIEVLEHINNPREELQKFHQLLRPGGVLYMTTPNFNSLSRRMLKEKWNIIEYPEHLAYYTPKTIDQLLRAEGFQKVSLITSGFSPSRVGVYNQDGNTPAESPKAKEEHLREMMEERKILQLAKKMINGTLNSFGLGDTIKVKYIKSTR